MESDSQQSQERWQRFAQGDKDAEIELFVQYKGLVESVVFQLKRRLPSHVLLDDLRASGFEGLWKAIRGYVADKGVPFEPYARLRIQGTILDELRRVDVLSRSNRQQLRQAQAAYQTQSQVAGNHVSLDDEERMEWLVDDSAVSPEEAVLRSSEVAELNRALVRLSEQEQLVLALVFNEGLNLVEVAEVLSLSRSRVGVIYNKALKSMKGSIIRGYRCQK